MEKRQRTSRSEGRRTTLKDVAGMAGVSLGTASLVLSGRAEERRISPKVERLVREIAEQQGYVPNLLVQSMQKGRTHVMSFYSAYRRRDLNDLYMDRVSTAIEVAAAERGYDLLIHRAGGRTADEVFRLLVGGFSDGVLFFGPPAHSELLNKLRDSHLPAVLFNHTDPEGRLPFVSDDWRDGMRQLAGHLAALGHRHIAAMDGSPDSDGFQRISALREALEGLGISLPETRVTSVYKGFRTPEEGLQTIMAAKPAPTALFCWHDRLGYEVLEAAERMGIRIPDDLSLIGYDGLHWPSTSPHVLTSLQVSLVDAAQRAIQKLDERIENSANADTIEGWCPVRLLEGTTVRSLLV